LLLLVDKDQHLAVYRLEQPGALDLTRLKNHVAVRQDHGRSPGSEPLNHVERVRVEAIGERVIHEERRQQEQARLVQVCEAVALQRAEVIGVTELSAQLLKDRPVAIAVPGSKRMLKVGSEVLLDSIVV